MKAICAILLLVTLVGASSASSNLGAPALLVQQGYEKQPVIGQGYDKQYQGLLVGQHGFGFDKRTLESSGLRKPITYESLQKYYRPIKEDYRL